MSSSVEIDFDCVPLRSVPRWDVPLDATPRFRNLCKRMRQAAATHGNHNSYYLHSGRCVFRLTNDAALGRLVFAFEGTALTDAQDRNAVDLHLQVTLEHEACDWLVAPVLSWFHETVRHAVLVDFQRYLEATESEKRSRRQRWIELEMVGQAGFVGVGI